jgi:general secretion pathway protein G
MRSAMQLRSADARFPRSEPQASGDRARSAVQLRSADARFPRSEPQASGEVHQARARDGNRLAGFTLIEIMAVVLIIGLLTAVVGTAIFGQIDKARVTTAKTQMKNIEAALDFYRMDNGRYPTTEQGLDALVHQPSTEPVPRQYRPEGYITGGRVPLDPWGSPFEYQAPGQRNTYGFDIWSFGADGQPGGKDVDADIGNWSEDTSS